MQLLILLLLMHFIGDFYIKFEQKISIINKSTITIKVDYMIINSLLYIMPFIFLINLTKLTSLIVILTIMYISHFIINSLLNVFESKINKSYIFIINQVLHYIVLFIIYTFFTFNNVVIICLSNIIYIITVVLFLIKPSIYFIECIFEDTFNKKESLFTVTNNKFDVGSVIGVFERLIILVLIMVDALTTIAIIITVKTWARTPEIKKDINHFSDKYIMGTLISLALSLFASFFLKYILLV